MPEVWVANEVTGDLRTVPDVSRLSKIMSVSVAKNLGSMGDFGQTQFGPCLLVEIQVLQVE